MIPPALREGFAWRWQVLVAQLPGRAAPHANGRARWRELWSWGGVAFRAPLAGTDREARLVLQPDGDALLFLPTDFGADAADAAALAALLDATAGDLRAMRLAAQSGRLGAALVLLEAASAGGALAVPGFQAVQIAGWALGSGAAFPWAGLAWAAGAVGLPVGLRQGLRRGWGWLIRRAGRNDAPDPPPH